MNSTTLILTFVWIYNMISPYCVDQRCYIVLKDVNLLPFDIRIKICIYWPLTSVATGEDIWKAWLCFENIIRIRWLYWNDSDFSMFFSPSCISMCECSFHCKRNVKTFDNFFLIFRSNIEKSSYQMRMLIHNQLCSSLYNAN
jgi:hypothetical protein